MFDEQGNHHVAESDSRTWYTLTADGYNAFLKLGTMFGWYRDDSESYCTREVYTNE